MAAMAGVSGLGVLDWLPESGPRHQALIANGNSSSLLSDDWDPWDPLSFITCAGAGTAAAAAVKAQASAAVPQQRQK